MTFAEWKENKRKLGYTEKQMAELSGVSVEVVHEIFSGHRVPDAKTWFALDRALKRPNNILRDENTPYLASQQEGYTIKDYYAMPSETRVELIDGEIYDMAAPSLVHQLVSFELAKNIRDYIDERNGQCVTFVAPVDVQLNCDDFTMVQPDLIVVCDRDKLKNKRCVYGAPDLVIEVLSSSTKIKDMSVKLMAYMNAGVREYWIVDPEKKKVIVYTLEEDYIPRIYGINARVPVGIFYNQCEIDFAEIYQKISFLYDESNS